MRTTVCYTAPGEHRGSKSLQKTAHLGVFALLRAALCVAHMCYQRRCKQQQEPTVQAGQHLSRDCRYSCSSHCKLGINIGWPMTI